MPRKGFATLLGLVTLAIAAVAVTSMAVQAQGVQRSAIVSGHAHLLATALADGERFTQAWLDKHGPDVVLPPSGGLLLLLDHAWTDARGRDCRLAIAIADVCATLPPAALTPGHPLRFAMASPGQAPRFSGDPGSVAPADLLSQITRPSSWLLLPPGIPPHQPVGSTLPWSRIANSPITVAWFAPDHPGAINANTAPASLLRLLATDGCDPERILTDRAAGKPWRGSITTGPHGMQIMATSIRWHILLDASCGGHQAIRWAVADGANGRTQIIRRHDATP